MRRPPTLLFPIIAICCLALPAHAQTVQAATLTIPTGKIRYTVAGEFQGDRMEPWEAETTVRDTIIEGKKLVVVTRRTIRTAMNASFEASAFLDPATGTMMSLEGWNKGNQAMGSFQLRHAGGKIEGTDKPDGEVAAKVSTSLPDDAVPDFALASLVAGRSLAESGTVTVPVFTYADQTVRVYAFKGKVSGSTFRRDGTTVAEPVWVVTGDSAYPARIVIARSDRRPLQVLMPEGSVGSQTDTFAATSRP